MKKTLLTTAVLTAICLSGCQKISTEADKFKTETVNTFNKASQQVVDTKNKVDQKVQQAKDAADAINKLTGS